jgi:hypothetical protein
MFKKLVRINLALDVFQFGNYHRMSRCRNNHKWLTETIAVLRYQILQINDRRLRWAGHVAHMGRSRSAYRTCWENQEKRGSEICVRKLYRIERTVKSGGTAGFQDTNRQCTRAIIISAIHCRPTNLTRIHHSKLCWWYCSSSHGQ